MEPQIFNISVLKKSKAEKKRLTIKNSQTSLNKLPGSSCCAPKNNTSICCSPSQSKEENNGACCAQPDDGSACCDK